MLSALHSSWIGCCVCYWRSLLPAAFEVADIKSDSGVARRLAPTQAKTCSCLVATVYRVQVAAFEALAAWAGRYR
jgi:hypothetical protein